MIKIILLPIDGSEGFSKVAQTACIVANRYNAHIKTVHVLEPIKEPYMFNSLPDHLRKEYAKINEQAGASLVEGIQSQFEAFCKDNGIEITENIDTSDKVTASLHILKGDPVTILSEESRLVDVVAMGRPDFNRRGRRPVGDTVESILMNSGRPVLIVPPDWEAHRADRAAIGWNNSVEASRAVHMTLPWLVQMQQVTILVSAEKEESGARVMRYLQRHGCTADYRLIEKGGNIGEKLLDNCKSIGAEFLVIGGFSHTRVRQRLFGGVTEHLLKNTDIITVMVH